MMKDMDNQTTVSEFFLMGVSRNQKLQILHFVVFLAIYLAALMGNLLITTTISLHHHLHTPIYFFLKSLSFLDICFISVTIPKSFINSLMNSWTISFQGCVAQLFLFLSFIERELLFLTIMAYDLYIAICNPLNYTVIVNKTACRKLACGSWLGGGIYSALNTASTFSLPFCGSLINQFFCDILPLLKLSCSHPNVGETVLIAFGVCVALCCFAFITMSYIHIFSAVLKIPSVEGCHKAFSTLMSFDQYLAICKPLHNSSLMNTRICLQLLAAGSWLNGCLASAIFVLFMSHLIFCGPNEIDHFYCDLIPLIKLSCSDTHLIVLLDFVLSCVFTLPPFLLTLTSYVCILTTILRIPSTTGRQKAFSTCSSYLIVVTIYYGTLMTVYLILKCDTLSFLNKVVSLCYTVLTPLVNPLIYSLRNREDKEALSKAVSKYVAFTKTFRES
uniref:G-protein coupled receptors family 1 profile domain-containing protein n=1 Tax=Gopherus evgoodei TaxID=1825980 RepID=A0A8C4Y5S8_9SAUR